MIRTCTECARENGLLLLDEDPDGFSHCSYCGEPTCWLGKHKNAGDALSRLFGVGILVAGFLITLAIALIR